VLSDAVEIHRLVAARHGTQRARLGWDEEGVRCEYEILRVEMERTIRQAARSAENRAVEEAVVIVTRFLDQAEQISLRALTQARGRAQRAESAR
jgi:hypothetical protein